MRRHELSEMQWNRIKDLLPPGRKPQGGRPAKSNREMLNAMVYWLNTAIPWRDLPERFGHGQSVYSRFRAWTKASVWEDVLAQLIQQDIVDETTLMLDSTSIKVHQHASSCKKGAAAACPSATHVYNITPVGMDVKGGEAVHCTLDIQTQRCYSSIRSAK